MKKIIATEQIFSPLSNGKPVAIRYHYADGTTADAPVIRDLPRAELDSKLRKAIEAFEKKHQSGH